MNAEETFKALSEPAVKGCNTCVRSRLSSPRPRPKGPNMCKECVQVFYDTWESSKKRKLIHYKWNKPRG